MWSVETNGCSHQNERRCDYSAAGVCGRRQTLLVYMWLFLPQTARWRRLCRLCRLSGLPLLFEASPPPPLSSAHNSPWNQTETTQISSLSLSLSLSLSSLNWSCPVWCGPVQSSHLIFRHSPVALTRWLTYSLSCLTCMCASIGFLACRFVLDAPHHMLQKRTAERQTQWCDIQATRYKDSLNEGNGGRPVVSLPVLTLIKIPAVLGFMVLKGWKAISVWIYKGHSIKHGCDESLGASQETLK